MENMLPNTVVVDVDVVIAVMVVVIAVMVVVIVVMVVVVIVQLAIVNWINKLTKKMKMIIHGNLNMIL